MSRIKWILRTSLMKTLASKFRCRVSEIRKKYQVVLPDFGDGPQKYSGSSSNDPAKTPW